MFQQQTTTNFDLSTLKALFVYGNISTKLEINDDDFLFYSRIDLKKDFINFAYIGDEPNFRPTAQSPGGWKLHVAIDDRNLENLSRAWNLIVDILIEQRICESKIIKREVSFWNNASQCGKQITIYQFYNPNRDWNSIINQIESRLCTGDEYGEIPRGQFSPTDRLIPESRYISYRNDLSQNGEYAMATSETMQFPEAIRYNPFNRPDPFASIVIQPAPAMDEVNSGPT